MAARDNFAGIFSQVATRASEQGHANFIGKIVAAPHKKALAKKLNTKLDKFKGDVATLIIGVSSGLNLSKEPRSQEDPSKFTGGETHEYKTLSTSWLKKKAKYGVPTPSFFKFSKVVKRTGARGGKTEENTPQKFLGDYLNEKLSHASAKFGAVKPADIKIFNEQGEEMKLKGGGTKESRAIKAAGGTQGSRIYNFSPKGRKYSVRVRLMPNVRYLGQNPIRLQYFVARILDPTNNNASGFARSKLGRQAVGRPNVGHLLLWYYQVKLPAVIKSHYSHTKVKEI
jgi:hypothetical protein